MLPTVLVDYLTQLEDLIDLAKENFAEIQRAVDEGGRNKGMNQWQYRACMAHACDAHLCVNHILDCIKAYHVGDDRHPPPRETTPA